jgi:hypothetical protein
MFHPDKAREKKEEGEEEGKGPLEVEGLGDEAFWVGNNTIGVLHVLKGDGYITLSVGGPEDQAVKIEKTKTLARAILPRL